MVGGGCNGARREASRLTNGAGPGPFDGMEKLRTPDQRFADLPGWEYDARHVEDLPGYEGLRVAYVDVGLGAGPVFLCLHGQPTWAYLYRRMIPLFAESGRVVAPDLIGFGRSDKPLEDGFHTFDAHRAMLLRFVERLDLRDITLVVQDWGGILGLTLPMELGDRVRRLLIMNTALPVGEAPSGGFIQWRDYCRSNPDFDIGRLMARACAHLTEGEAAAYAAPFPDGRHRAAVRRFPEMVMTDPDMDGIDHARRARRFLAEDWDGQSFMAVGPRDPVLGGGVMEELRRTIRGCPEPMVVSDAGHFVQEWGDGVARAALAHWGG